MDYAYKKCEPKKFFFSFKKDWFFLDMDGVAENLFNIVDLERRRILSTLRLILKSC